jgi:hypothetical protein
VSEDIELTNCNVTTHTWGVQSYISSNSNQETIESNLPPQRNLRLFRKCNIEWCTVIIKPLRLQILPAINPRCVIRNIIVVCLRHGGIVARPVDYASPGRAGEKNLRSSTSLTQVFGILTVISSIIRVRLVDPELDQILDDLECKWVGAVRGWEAGVATLGSRQVGVQELAQADIATFMRKKGEEKKQV